MCFVDKKTRRLCSFFDIDFSIFVAASLQMIEVTVSLTFFQWVCSIIPSFFVLLTSCACCLRHNRHYRTVLFWLNVIHAFLATIGYIIFMVLVIRMNVPEKTCEDWSRRYPDGSIKVSGLIYSSMDICITSIRFWYYFGFAFYFSVVIPSSIVYLEIFYYWMKDIEKPNSKSEKVDQVFHQTEEQDNSSQRIIMDID